MSALFLSCGNGSESRSVNDRSGTARFELGVLLDYCPPPICDTIPEITLDVAQWVRAVKDARIRHVVMEAEGNAGFCLWNTVQGKDGVRNRCWKGGWGDAVREFVQACRKEHLTAGIALDVRDEDGAVRLKELCTGYGNLPWIWTRGADVSAVIARYQPGAVHFGGGDPLIPEQAVVTLTPDLSFSELQELFVEHINQDRNLLLRVCIDSSGVVAPWQSILLKRFGTWVNTSFRHPVRACPGAAKYIRLPGPSREYVNYLVIEQNTDRGGKRILEYVVETYDPEGKRWYPIYNGYEIGAKHIVPLDAVVDAQVRLKVVRAHNLPRLRHVGFY